MKKKYRIQRADHVHDLHLDLDLGPDQGRPLDLQGHHLHDHIPPDPVLVPIQGQGLVHHPKRKIPGREATPGLGQGNRGNW